MKFIIVLFALLVNSVSYAETLSFEERIKAAMEAEVRSPEEKQRDRNRRPVETLEFLGIESNMKVLELMPGGGWYTKLIAPALYEDGELYVAIGTSRVKERLTTQDGFDRIKVLDLDIQSKEGNKPRLRTLDAFGFGETGFDAAVTFRNMHNFDDVGRKNINDAVFIALKPGGIYGVIDHTRRHMEPFTMENRRRADPVEIIKEALQAGFEFVDYSDIHYRADDELEYEVGRKSVTGNTDRFTLLFKKPAK